VCVFLALDVGHAEAQRRRRRTPRATPPATTTTTEPTPPPDPFAEGGDEAAPTPPASTTPPAAPPPTPPAAPTASTPSTPAASTATTSAPTSEPVDPGPTPPDLAPLRADYTTLMDDMVAARQLVATLGEELFRTRVAITVQDRAGDRQTLASFALELDGSPVFHVEGEIEGGGEGRQVYEGALAPGPHVLTVATEQRARENPEYRYVQRDTYRFVVVRDRRTELTLVLEDDSDIAQHFQSDGEGRYDVHTRVRVATRALE
jgi:hypothetical protein